MLRGSAMRKTYGTGSYPLPPQGLHLNIRQIASARPFIGPCFIIASLAYCEHVGVNLHAAGVNGLMHFWYIHIGARSIATATLRMIKSSFILRWVLKIPTS